MIDIKQDHKGEGFRISQTQNIEGMDFHKELNLSPNDMDDLATWVYFHYAYLEPGTSIEKAYKQMNDMIIPVDKDFIVYSYFNGVSINSNMSFDELYQKVIGCNKADFGEKVEEERRKYANKH